LLHIEASIIALFLLTKKEPALAGDSRVGLRNAK